MYIIFNKIILSSTKPIKKNIKNNNIIPSRLYIYLYIGTRGVLHVVAMFQLTVFIKLVRHDRENISLIYLRVEFKHARSETILFHSCALCYIDMF